MAGSEPNAPWALGTGARLITQDDVDRWTSWVQGFPLPSLIAPTTGGCMDNLSDETLLTLSPHVLVHLQRTASQGGLQVVSPRQTPVSAMMTRVAGEARALGDHVVGSIASQDDEWPTVDGETFEHLLPDEPLPNIDAEASLRTKTRSDPITKAHKLMSDPILACLLKGRAMIDVLRRDDVSGDADTMTRLLASAWGISPMDLMEMDAFTLGIEGPLLRHAIRADEVFPTTHAPVQSKRCISVGVSDVTRDVLPRDTALDWRRLRVFCEAVFLMSCSIEGYPLKALRCSPPPGDPNAPLGRPNTLAFRINPAVAWSFAPETFSVCPTNVPPGAFKSQIPMEVLEAMSKYVRDVRPMSYALATGHQLKAKTTTIGPPRDPNCETLSSAYTMMCKTITISAARGKGPGRAVRDYIFQAIENTDLPTRLRIARYLKIAKAEVQTHLGLSEVPDVVIHSISNRFLKVGELIRLKVAEESNRRGDTAKEWWHDIIAQVPKEYKMMAEGTMGWARVAMWLIFKAPMRKWEGLVKALNYNALRKASVGSIGGIPLPPDKRGSARLLTAARHVVAASAENFSGYYAAVGDVAYAIAEEAEARHMPRTAENLREAAYLWALRSRALRGTNVSLISPDESAVSGNYIRIPSMPMDLLVVPSPYRAFNAYVKHAKESPNIPPFVKKTLSSAPTEKMSNVFRSITRPIIVSKDSLVTRYLNNPARLADDLEKGWRELAEDVKSAVAIISDEALEVELGRQSLVRPRALAFQELDIQLPPAKRPGDECSYFDLLGDMDADSVDWYEATIEELPRDVADAIYERSYRDENELYDCVTALSKEFSMSNTHVIETVR